MRILGIDPALGSCGMAVVMVGDTHEPRFMAGQAVKQLRIKGKVEPRERTLSRIREEVLGFGSAFSCHHAAIEYVKAPDLGVSEARGVCRQACHEIIQPGGMIVSFGTEWQKRFGITGSSKARKVASVEAFNDLFRLDFGTNAHDITDAALIALYFGELCLDRAATQGKVEL